MGEWYTGKSGACLLVTSLPVYFFYLSQHDSEIVLNFFHSFGLRDDEFVQGIDIGFRAGNDDIGIRAVAAINARVLHLALSIHGGVTVRALNADSDFAERIDTSSNCVHIELK